MKNSTLNLFAVDKGITFGSAICDMITDPLTEIEPISANLFMYFAERKQIMKFRSLIVTSPWNLNGITVPPNQEQADIAIQEINRLDRIMDYRIRRLSQSLGY